MAFVITTPYLLVSWPEFVRDVLLHRDVTREGSLGKLTGTGLTLGTPAEFEKAAQALTAA